MGCPFRVVVCCVEYTVISRSNVKQLLPSLRAKRSNPSLSLLKHGLLRRCAPRNDEQHHSRGAIMPEFRIIHVPPGYKRAQGTPGDGLTHGPPAVRKAGGSDHRLSRISRHSLRNGFTAYTCSPRCAGLVSHRHLSFIIDKLDTSVGVPGPHDFAVRTVAARLAAPTRPSHPASNVRDDRETPLLPGARRAKKGH
jgi:hypothetical protein